MTAGLKRSQPDTSPAAGPGRPALGAAAVALLAFFSALLPIMRHVMVAGGKMNLCAADLVVFPLFLALRRQWHPSGALGRWVLALWTVNLVSWSLSLSWLEPKTFCRESMKLLGCYLYAFVGYGLGRADFSARIFLKTLALSSAVISLGAIAAYAVGQPAAFIMDGRVVGSSTDPNAFAIFLAMQMPLVSEFWGAWLLIPLLLAGGAVTLSRTGLVCLTASLLLTARQAGLRRFLVIATLCLLVGAGTWGIFARDSLSRRVLQYEASLSTRQELWSLALSAGAARPIFGNGRGNWEVVTGRMDIAHNTFLQIIADTGFVGLLVFLLPVLFWMRAGLKETTARPWVIALFVGLVGGLAISLDNFRLFWLAAGGLAGKLWQLRADRARLSLAVGGGIAFND